MRTQLPVNPIEAVLKDIRNHKERKIRDNVHKFLEHLEIALKHNATGFIYYPFRVGPTDVYLLGTKNKKFKTWLTDTEVTEVIDRYYSKYFTYEYVDSFGWFKYLFKPKLKVYINV